MDRDASVDSLNEVGHGLPCPRRGLRLRFLGLVGVDLVRLHGLNLTVTLPITTLAITSSHRVGGQPP
jgi:hypothetical protein